MEPENGWPLYVMVPEIFVDNDRPARAVSKVVLPLPDGPSIARSSPGLTRPVTPLSNVLVGFGLEEVKYLHSEASSGILYPTSSNCMHATNHSN